ncbi:MAG: hypothetical protein IKR17_06980 [Bacteroidales bacterium]|nr:hypothetical protein [Bacteroidales bacterium]
MAKYKFYKKKETDKIWWVKDTDSIGRILFSFDQKKVFNFFTDDVPAKLTQEQWAIFQKERPSLAELK